MTGPDRAEHIEVAVALPVFQTYCYGVPPNFRAFVLPGKRVLVPFGRRRVTGYVMGASTAVDGKPIKDILDVLDESPLFPESMIRFFRWIAEYYFHHVGVCISGALPGGLNLHDVSILEITPGGHETLRSGNPTPLERRILTELQAAPCRLKKISRTIGKDLSHALIYSLTSRGDIRKYQQLKGGRTRSRQERFLAGNRLPDPADKISPVKRHILEVVSEKGEISVAQLKEIIPRAANHIAALEKKGLLSVHLKRIYRDPLGEPIRPDHPPRLTGEQETVVSRVLSSLGKGFDTYLLAGVTGSGKTEVYMRIAAEAVARKMNVIVLVPEIALITQMERRFRARFGERVAVLHSGLSAGERYDEWDRIARGDVAIAIGARSAVFAPFDRIGLIVVDEEHDGSYKQESGLRYNARDLAIVRARLNDAIALLGSATPSVQSFHNVNGGKFKGLTLSRRVLRRAMPEIAVVDLRETRDARGMGKYLTPQLLGAMKQTLDRGEQVLLFLNRRGYASYPVCGSCGETLRCKNCDIPLTLHLKANAFKCHYCGFTRPGTTRCPECGADNIKRLGLGTEKVESAVKELFPGAEVARMDRDTTTRKGAMLSILKRLRERTINVLVGTQMVTKGHDFPHITLVGIVCADLSLSFPDFRAGERTYQLLAQVSGRAGRGDVPGRVILQTYNPDHFSIRSAGEQDYDAFYRKEIGFRKALNYPPYSRIIQLRISGRDPKKTRDHAEAVGDACRSLQDTNGAAARWVEVLGPIEAPMARIAGRYRWQVLLKGTRVKPLRGFVRDLLSGHPALLNNRDVRLTVDVDPYFMS